MKSRFFIVLTCLFILITSIPLLAQEDTEKEFLNVFHSISSHDIRDYIVELTSDKYRGRLTGPPEFLEVAQWVADNLKEWGLEPYGDEGTYFQWFNLPWTDIKDIGNLTIHTSDENGSTIDKKYVFADNYYPGSNSDSGTVTGDVVYVGWGITAPDLGYDDYAGIDVKGKIALFESEAPISRNEEEFARWVPYSLHTHKLNNAAAHGVAGVIYINKIANPNTCFNKGLVYTHVGTEVADDFFAGTGKLYKEVRDQISKTLKPASFATGKRATITNITEHHTDGRGCNVVGLVKGTDPVLMSEVIIVGGHLDGVGDHGKIIPGANDNASANACMLAAAKALAASPVKLKRSVLFIFIGAEESTLVGSRFYCDNPLIPEEKIVCFFNLDMVGVGSGLSVTGGLTYPLVNRCFEEANDKYIHRPFRATNVFTGGVARPRRDSVIFTRAGYRTLEFRTFYQEGEKRKASYYHHPLDIVETLSPEIMEDLAKLMFVGLTNMANTEKLFE